MSRGKEKRQGSRGSARGGPHGRGRGSGRGRGRGGGIGDHDLSNQLDFVVQQWPDSTYQNAASRKGILIPNYLLISTL